MNKKFIINYLSSWSTLIILWFIIVAKSRQKMTIDFVRRETARLRRHLQSRNFILHSNVVTYADSIDHKDSIQIPFKSSFSILYNDVFNVLDSFNTDHTGRGKGALDKRKEENLHRGSFHDWVKKSIFDSFD